MKHEQRNIPLLSQLLLILFSASTALGQADMHPSFTLFGAFNHNMHAADFRMLPGVPSCCPRFEYGYGPGLSAGAGYDLPLGGRFMLTLRASYSTHDAVLRMTESLPVDVDGTRMVADIDHLIDTHLSSSGIESLLAYRIRGGFFVTIGMRTAVVLGASYAQHEQLIRPEGGTFENDRRVRNEFAGDIPNASTLTASILGGVSYDLPLDRAGRIRAAPELLYAFGVTPVATTLAWNAHAIRAGVSLKYQVIPGPAHPLQPPGPASSPVAPTRPQHGRKPALEATITAIAVHAGEESSVGRIVVEEFVSTNMHPLLPYVFFDDNSDEIPVRYVRLRNEETNDYRIDEFHSAATLDVYRNILNIVGQRLREHPSSELTLVGCNADHGSEIGNTELSRSRALRIADYLSNVWDIDAGRMHVVARGLPESPSIVSDPDGAAENRRVELFCSDGTLLQPVSTESIERQISPPEIIFVPQIRSEAGVARWYIHVHQGERKLTSFSGLGMPPQRLSWQLEKEFDYVLSESHDIVFYCEVTDVEGQTVRASEASMPVEQITVRKKRLETASGDKEIHNYSLILFDYDKTELDQHNLAIARMIQDEIRSTSLIHITGYTDRIGDAGYNVRISEKRAKNTANALGAASAIVRGLGNTVKLLDNDIPEGRMYSRTVHIRVETPL
jgi:outer membrane protein OmpA-like peptidoglycan-associated protein